MIKPFDIPVIAIALAITIAAAVYTGDGASSRVIVRGPDRTWIFPLDAEAEAAVTGVLGETIVRIGSGQAAIVSSPCNGQTCVAAGALRKNGQWAACLPNRVFMLVEGAEGEDAVDAVSR